MREILLVALTPTSIKGAAAHVYRTVSGTERRRQVFSPRNGISKSMPAVIFFMDAT